MHIRFFVSPIVSSCERPERFHRVIDYGSCKTEWFSDYFVVLSANANVNNISLQTMRAKRKKEKNVYKKEGEKDRHQFSFCLQPFTICSMMVWNQISKRVFEGFVFIAFSLSFNIKMYENDKISIKNWNDVKKCSGHKHQRLNELIKWSHNRPLDAYRIFSWIVKRKGKKWIQNDTK